MTYFFRFVLIFFLLPSLCLKAKNQKLHIHGMTTSAISSENNNFTIQLTSPAEYLLGFEHKASLQEELATIDKVQEKLSSPQRLLSFERDSCTLKDLTLDLSEFLAKWVTDHGQGAKVLEYQNALVWLRS